MARQNLKDGENKGIFRTKLNENFIDLYTDKHNHPNLSTLDEIAFTPASQSDMTQAQSDISTNRTNISALQGEATAKWVLLNEVDNRSRNNANRITAIEESGTGQNGEAATIEIGEVTTVSPDTPAGVRNTGTKQAAVFDFDIPQGKQGLDNYEIYVADGGTKTRQEWLDSITTIVEGENILNRSVIGVSGILVPITLSQGVSTKIAFSAKEGNTSLINSNGYFIAPENGVYKMCGTLGYVGGSGTRINHFEVKTTNRTLGNIVGMNNHLSLVDIFSESVAIIKLLKGEPITFWAYTSVATSASALINGRFIITLDTSININTWDLYIQWKKQDPERDNMSFDDFIIWVSEHGGI